MVAQNTVQYFQRYCQRLGFGEMMTSKAQKCMTVHYYEPGNIHGLKNESASSSVIFDVREDFIDS